MDEEPTHMAWDTLRFSLGFAMASLRVPPYGTTFFDSYFVHHVFERFESDVIGGSTLVKNI